MDHWMTFLYADESQNSHTIVNSVKVGVFNAVKKNIVYLQCKPCRALLVCQKYIKCTENNIKISFMKK